MRRAGSVTLAEITEIPNFIRHGGGSENLNLASSELHILTYFMASSFDFVWPGEEENLSGLDGRTIGRARS